MLLKKMNLENFRQFIGTQSIDFSTEPDRNVTIILGENGSGKTTLAQAFTWCLYGDTDFDDKNVLNKKVWTEWRGICKGRTESKAYGDRVYDY